jgi:hydroxymethylpyrimidine pyrophosphatase-like HAD family hydrolase
MIQALNRKLSSPHQHVIFTIATGRALAGIAPLLNQLHLRPNVPIAAYNGSLVLLPQRPLPLYEATIPQESFRELLQLVAQLNLPTLAYVCAFSPQTDELFGSLGETVYGWYVEDDRHLELNGLPITRLSLAELPAGVEPIAVLLDVRGRSGFVAGRLRTQLGNVPGLSVTQSSSSYVEVRPTGANKAVAISRIAASLGIAREDVLTIGDNDNDTEMLQWAGIGVAVAGASAAALQSSTYYCRHGVELGVVEVLRTVRQAKRFHGFLLGDDAIRVGGL